MGTFAYPDGHASQDILYVPVGRPVRLIMTSRDVIHSFFVPACRVKRDVVPGRSSTTWFEVKEPGRYQVFCAEYCGLDHSRMCAEVVALESDEYARVLDEDLPQEKPLAERGEEIAGTEGCLRCHTLDGTPHIGAIWAGLYDSDVPLTSGETVTADFAYLTDSMMDPSAKVHLGFRPVMPSYLGKLAPYEVGARIALIRSLRDIPAEPVVEKLP